MMWMTGVSFGFMILVATPVLLWSRARGGFAAINWGPVRRKCFPAMVSLPVGPRLLLWAIGATTVPCCPTPLTILTLAGPPCWRSPFQTGVTRPGLLCPASGLSGGGCVVRCWILVSLMIATPMER